MAVNYPSEHESMVEWAKTYLPVLKAQDSLYEFAKQSWTIIEGHKVPFKDAWHIGAICEHLEAATRRDIKNLIINIPLRCMKSTLVSVMWPAWVWITHPHEKFVFASHALKLSRRDSVRCRRLISSPWYQERWGHYFSLSKDQNVKERFDNDMNGYRIATSVSSGSTGEGGNFIVCDDPNNASDTGESATTRDSTNDWFDQEYSNRLNDSANDVLVVIQQRFHEKDVTGHILSKQDANDWVKLILPMEFDTKRKAKTIVLPSSNGKAWEDPRTTQDELLCPLLHGPKQVLKLKYKLGSSYRVSGQLQQLPSPSEGGLIKRSWFKLWKAPYTPVITQVVQSWDTALEDKKEDAYNVCETWGLFKDDLTGNNNLMFLGMWRKKAQYPDLRKRAIRMYRDFRDYGETQIIPDEKHVPDAVIVERKASGHGLIHDLRRAGINAIGFDPKKYGDKTNRVNLATYMIEGGRIWVRGSAPYYTHPEPLADQMMDLCAMFPNGESRDVVDSLTQIILFLRERGYLTHASDEEWEASSTPNHPFYGADRER